MLLGSKSPYSISGIVFILFPAIVFIQLSSFPTLVEAAGVVAAQGTETGPQLEGDKVNVTPLPHVTKVTRLTFDGDAGSETICSRFNRGRCFPAGEADCHKEEFLERMSSDLIQGLKAKCLSWVKANSPVLAMYKTPKPFCKSSSKYKALSKKGKVFTFMF